VADTDEAPSREAVRALFTGPNACGIWLENLLSDREADQITDAVMSLLVDTDAPMFPPGCTCERLDAGTSGDEPGTRFIRGRSDPPCKVHLPQERALYDTAFQRGYTEGRNNWSRLV
jgi:hypothetical protein